MGLLALAVAISGFRPIWRITFWKKKEKKSPIKENLLAYPGKTIMERIEDKSLDSLFYGLLLVFMPVLSWLVYSGLIGNRLGRFSLFYCGGFTLAVTGAGCLLLRKRFRQLRDWRFGLDAELAVGEELNKLMRHGFYIFHDLQADGFNIDHVIVGPPGVFAVETKARAKIVGRGEEGAKVLQKGKVLKFPNGFDRESIPQAENEAKWLADFIRKSVGKDIPAQAVLALPGWYVERGPHDGTVLVINPKSPERFFTKRQITLDDQTIQQVVYQVEQRCRTIKPFDPF